MVSLCLEKNMSFDLVARSGQSFFLWRRLPCPSRKWMKGFPDWLRQRSFSLFMMLGWSSVSVAFLIILSIYMALVDRILVYWSLIL